MNICTFHRREYIDKNVKKLLSSRFFEAGEKEYYGHLHIYVVDNASEIPLCDDEYFHVLHNCNSGGSGGFQRGIEAIRRSTSEFTHVIFMDDDVKFELDSFYILYDYLRQMEEAYVKRPVAGRMLCMDRPDIQYTAAEIWNDGDIQHVEYMRDISKTDYTKGKYYDSGADYGGWWFCCFPMEFVRQNDIEPFFLHCDDVEYGLRCGKPPIIIEGVHVWHETFDKRITPIIQYYDTRNPLFVNELYQTDIDWTDVLSRWKAKITECHVRQDWITEYYIIRALNDYMKGMKWLRKLDSRRYHTKLLRKTSSRYKNAICWRIVEARYKRWVRKHSKKQK